jgi:sugar (pentulose or hexulose) kinase
MALDLGGSARCTVGEYNGDGLTVEVLRRFNNPYVRILDEVFWNAPALFAEVTESLKQVAGVYDPASFAGVGIDTMGIAFALLDANGALVGIPYYHRLPQDPAIHEAAYSRMDREKLFTLTGMQPDRLHSLHGLLALRMDGSPLLDIANTFLMYADLLNYWLTGRIASEYTVATLSHLIDVRKRRWALDLIETMYLPSNIFPEIIEPGTVWGELHPSVRLETDLPAIPVMAVGSHDTASAIAAVPASNERHAYVSSGTFGMIGVEITEPILTKKALDYTYSNEGGVANTIRFIHNNINLWLVKECRRIWAEEGKAYTWEELTSLAEKSEPFTAFIDPNAPKFALPSNMPEAIRQFCSKTGQFKPQTEGQMSRVILESLAFMYRDAVDKLTEITGRRPEVLHIVGGGGRSRLLNQFAANATRMPVIAGPYEATSIGNIIVQMIGSGALSNLAEGRELVRRSFPTETFTPKDTDMWEDYYHRYKELIMLYLP